MPAIDVFWLNHSMTLLPNRPPQLTVPRHLIDDLEICSTQYQARAFVWLPVRCRQRDRGFSDLHGSDGNRNCIWFITGTRTYRRPDAGQTQANGTLRTGGPGRFAPFETDVGIEVSMTLHESNHGTQNGKNGPVH